MFLRGRRRVGKTWLLQSLENDLGHEACFRLMCRKHRRDIALIKDAIADWAARSGQSNLPLLRPAALSWKLFFDDVARHARAYQAKHRRSYVLIIDEVQWLSTGYEESAGVLKAAWDEWAHDGSIRIVACGSSARFFAEQLGEGAILRGIRTQADIEVLPFPIGAIKKFVAPNWTTKEVALGYMCLGGIPYYWQRLSPEKGFRRAINDACCTSSTIFLDEWQEIIATEFRTDAVGNLERLFPTLMSAEDGVTLAEITEKLGIGVSSASRLLEKLVAYGYVQRCSPEKSPLSPGRPLKTARGVRYVLQDFYLHFYFTVLRPMAQDIRLNQNGLLFPYKILQGDEKEYIPAFTGKAFERLIFYHLDVGLRSGEHSPPPDLSMLWRKLDLPDASYMVQWNVIVRGDTSDKIISQIDVLLIHDGEKSIRVIECKWKGQGEIDDINDVEAKILPQRYQSYSRRNLLAISYEPTTKFRAISSQRNVNLITLDDLL